MTVIWAWLAGFITEILKIFQGLARMMSTPRTACKHAVPRLSKFGLALNKETCCHCGVRVPADAGKHSGRHYLRPVAEK